MTLYAFSGAIEQGLVYAIMALGVYITFRILEFPDLTVDGSLPLGAAVASVSIVNGFNPFIAVIFASIAGFLAGMVTGVLATKLKILHLLSSIITMTALYSINLRIMGRPNISLYETYTVFSPLEAIGLTGTFAYIALFAFTVLLAVLFIMWILSTEFGQALIATGSNSKMITSLGVNTNFTIIIGVGLSNALVATCGALVAQHQGFADVTLGVGTIVAGLASLIVGETLFGKMTIRRSIISVVLGSIAYRVVIALALSFKIGSFTFTASDLNLITAILVVFAILLPKIKSKIHSYGKQE